MKGLGEGRPLRRRSPAAEARIVEAQASNAAPLDLVSALVQDELQRRQDRLLDRRVKRAGFRDVDKTGTDKSHPVWPEELAHPSDVARGGDLRAGMR